MKETHEYSTICPHCTYFADRASGLTKTSPPIEGDVSLCIACGQFAVFDDKARLRKPTPAEQQELDTAPHLIKVKDAWRQTKRQTKLGLWPRARTEPKA